MASKFNQLYRGAADEVADTLENSEATLDELRLALINAMRKIELLERDMHTHPVPHEEPFRG